MCDLSKKKAILDSNSRIFDAITKENLKRIKKMIDSGVSDEMIINVYDLSEEELKEIKKKTEHNQEKVKDFIEEKKKNFTPKTVKGKNLKNGEPFEWSLEDKKQGRKIGIKEYRKKLLKELNETTDEEKFEVDKIELKDDPEYQKLKSLLKKYDKWN